LFGLAYPSLQGMMSRRVGPEEQGQLQGALGSLAGIAAIIAPGMFTQVFASAIRPGGLGGGALPGAPFLLAGLLLVVGMVVAQRERGRAAVALGPARGETAIPAADSD